MKKWKTACMLSCLLLVLFCVPAAAAGGNITIQVGQERELSASGASRSPDSRWSVDDDSVVSIAPDESELKFCTIRGLRPGTARVQVVFYKLEYDPNATPDWFGDAGENKIRKITEVWTVTVTPGEAEEGGAAVIGTPDDTDNPEALETPPTTAAKPDTAFADVPPNAYYAAPVAWAVENGITKGTSSTTFSPDTPCTVEQLVVMLWRANGSPARVTSLGANTVFNNEDSRMAAHWLWSNNVYYDYNNEAQRECRRWQAADFLWQLAGKPEPQARGGFADVPPDDFCADAIDWAVEQEIVKGVSADAFNPGGTCTRAQIVTFLYRAYGGEKPPMEQN